MSIPNTERTGKTGSETSLRALQRESHALVRLPTEIEELSGKGLGQIADAGALEREETEIEGTDLESIIIITTVTDAEIRGRDVVILERGGEMIVGIKEGTDLGRRRTLPRDRLVRRGGP
jgi:hypothetical protein